METLNVPFITLVSAVIVWGIYLTRMSWQNDKQSSTNALNMEYIKEEILKLDGKLDRLEMKIDMFMKNELDSFKSITSEISHFLKKGQ